MQTLRSIFRRPTRALLTIGGITIGVLALVMMGSIAEKLQLLVDGGAQYYADKVIVTDGATFAGFGMSPISAEVLEDAEEIEGVRRGSVTVNFLLEDDVQTISMGAPPMVEATDFRDVGIEQFVTPISEGREITAEGSGKVAVGADLVNQLGAEVGGTVEIRGEEFEVVGVYERTLSAPDSTVVMTLEDAQEIFIDTLPEEVSENLEVDTLATSIVLFAEEGEDPNDLVDVVREEFGDAYNVQGPSGFDEFVREPLQIFNYLIYAVGVIALVVGGLSVINTMTMAVAERTREIGIRKSIGATRTAILRQFLAEAAVIGAIGGLLGLGIGAAIVDSINRSGMMGTTELFLLTPRLAAGAVLFSFVLGVLAGLYPAWRAARLDPVQALRYE